MSTARLQSPLLISFRYSTRCNAPSRCYAQSQTRALCGGSRTFGSDSQTFLSRYRLTLGLALPTAALALPLVLLPEDQLMCESSRGYAQASNPTQTDTPRLMPDAKEPESIVNLRDLGFGTAAGICVGVFVKKGLRVIAFTLGGVFILMQYFSSRSLITINWANLTNSYESAMTKRAGPPASQGGNRMVGLSSWFVDFVTADIQQRATFLAGVALGFRLG